MKRQTTRAFKSMHDENFIHRTLLKGKNFFFRIQKNMDLTLKSSRYRSDGTCELKPKVHE